LLRLERALRSKQPGAGHRQAKLLKSCRAVGYRIVFIYLWLPSPQAAVLRVAQRVARGGHHIPEDVILRRYKVGIYNMRHMFLPLADVALIYDNSTDYPLLIGEQRSGLPFTVRDAARWKLIEEATREELHG
jgi:predicted ABC-type ATPase